MFRLHSFSFIVFLAFLALGWQVENTQARGFRVGLIPNGSENNCSNCHNNAGGGGPRTSFGQDVRGLVSPGGQEAFWNAILAAEDSDDDGFSNGIELGDIDGDGVPERTVNISRPGDENSFPETELGDCNLDTTLNADDLSCVTSIEDRDAVLSVLETLPGDFDGDGAVAFADFLVLSANFGSDLPSYADGNINLSGPIDFADFLILADNFGKSEAGTLAVVPEPSGGFLCILGVIPFAMGRHRRRRN